MLFIVQKLSSSDLSAAKGILDHLYIPAVA